MQFLIDTADVSNLTMKTELVPNFLGFTTNPNELSQLNLLGKEMVGLDDILYQLQATTNSLKGDTSGEVHIEIPTTLMTEKDIRKFIENIKAIKSPKSNIVIKIPPHPYVLKLTKNMLDVDFNVTGVTNPLTALRVFSYPQVKYVSFLLGRMLDAGITEDVIEKMIKYVRAANLKPEQKIIMGSIRSMMHIRFSWLWGCVPTIKKSLVSELEVMRVNPHTPVTPDLLEKSTVPIFKQIESIEKVHIDFFNEMNEKSLQFPIW